MTTVRVRAVRPTTKTVKVAQVGPAGPTGPTGPTGSSAANATYTHTQSSSSTTWTVVHNLGYFPGGVSVVDSGGTKVYGDVTHTNNNSLVITFSSAFGGKAYIS
jgi:cytoskeletal protein RodZ